MKVALVSTGTGHVWRGFERFSTDFFHLMKEEFDITLFKGGGSETEREVVVPHLRRNGLLSRMPFICSNSYRNPLYFEGLSYLLALLPRLIREEYDLVHYSAVPFENFLYHLKTKLKLKIPFKLLNTNGSSTVGQNLHRIDFLHEITPFASKNVIDFGIPPEKVFAIPSALHTAKFKRRSDRDSLRAKYGVPKDKRVVLSVAALNRVHKRTDYLIKEVAKLGKEYFLLMAGPVEDASLIPLAEELLGERFKFFHLPFEDADGIYSLADIFTVCSLEEGFCLAFVEAMSAKLPVVAHASPHFDWLIGDERCLIDMSVEDNLARKIEEVLSGGKELEEILHSNYDRAIRRFDWSVLKDRYVDMYERISNVSGKAPDKVFFQLSASQVELS